MKPLAPYFGNRFASVTKKKAIKSAAKTQATSEMEVLESRVLLSGVGTGINNRKNATFFDADGDKVTVKFQGKGSFAIDLGGNTNNADIANITINGDKDGNAGSLGVSVAPVGSFTKPVQTKAIYTPNGGLGLDSLDGNLDLGKGDLNQKIQTQYYDLTPGYTNIGSITSSAKTIGSIGLNAVVVPVIDLGDAAVGNINFSTGMIAKVDNFMNSNNEGYGVLDQELNGLSWNNGLSEIQVYDISAGSIAGINLAGHSTGVNNFLGTITTTNGGIGRLTGVNSSFDGNIVLEGANSSLGNVVMGNGFSSASTISAGGNLTFNAAGFGGLIDIAGHLNLGISGGGNFTGTIVADKGVSGLGASLTDTILVSGATLSGQIITAGDIASITLNASDFTGTLDATNIGTIHVGANSNLGIAGSGTILASGNLAGITVRNDDLNSADLKTIIVGDTIGKIDVAGGNLAGSFIAKNFSEVLVRGGDLSATLFASNSIGTVTVVDGALTGNLIAGAGGIGAITVTAINDGGNLDGIDGASIYSGGNIGIITATSVNGHAIGNDGDNTKIQAVGTIGVINATSFNGSAINGLDLLAPSLSAINATSAFGTAISGTNNFIASTGSVSNITAIGYTGGITGTTTITAKTDVGTINATARQSGDGISNLTINAGGIVSAISGTSNGSNGGDEGISNLEINATGNVSTITGTAFEGAGIYGSDITSINGNISDITGKSNGGYGIAYTNIVALAGNITNITGSSVDDDALFRVNVTALQGSVNNITGISVFNDGMDEVDVTALTGIGDITGKSVTNSGIEDSDFTVTGAGANIGNILGQTVSGIAINDSNFTSIGGTIQSITATPTGVDGRAIYGSDFKAATLGNISVSVTNLAGGYAIDGSTFTSTVGDIGNITVNNDSLANGASGISATTFTSAGSIGEVSVTTDGVSSQAVLNSTFTAADSIDDITIITNGATSNGIQNSQFTVNDDCVLGGDFGDVTVTVNGSGSNGIIQSKATPTFTALDGANIGVVTINVTHCDGNIAIQGSVAKDPVFVIDGNMTSFTIDDKGEAKAANGMENAKLDIVGTLGAVSITTVGGSGMVNSSIDPTTIASVAITVGSIGLDLGSEAMNASDVVATTSIGPVTIIGDVNTSDILAYDAVGDDTSTTLGDISITGDLLSSNIKAGTTIGKVNITGDANLSNIVSGQATDAAAGTITSITIGGDSNSSVTALVGNVGPVTVGGNFTGVVTAVEGSIGKVGITGDFSGLIQAGITVGDVTITGDASGTIKAAQSAAGTITSVSAGTVNGLTLASGLADVNPALNIDGTIGAITITDTDADLAQALSLNAVSLVSGATTTGGSTSTIKAEALSDAEVLSISVGADTISLGAITVAAPGGTPTLNGADLNLSGGSADLVTLGAITVDDDVDVSALTLGANASVGAIAVIGDLTTGAAFSTAKTMSTFSVGSLVGGPQTIGAASNLTGSIGLITVNSATIAPPAYTFNFGTFNGGGVNTVANIGASGTVETIAQVAGVPNAPVTNTGIAFTQV